MAAEGAMAVAGGNWQIFARMAQGSGAHVLLNTSVTSIALAKGENTASTTPRYIIRTTDSTSPDAKIQTQDVEFDDVVIATPWQFSGISHEDDLMEHPIESVPYAALHVTLFATPFRFAPEFFALEPGTEVPISVLTTLGEGEEPRPGSEGAGKAGFFSATLVKVVTNPKNQGREYVYKIFSPEAVTPEFLSSLLGVQVPNTSTRLKGGESENSSMVDPISWIHPTVFNPYPQKLPRVTFQDPILGQGLYYTSGIESFISTMETSALMGMNVARLITDDYLGFAHRTGDTGESTNQQHVVQLQDQAEAAVVVDEL
jgi:prenylcysteine oxidase / farnesylcysteine lyase